MFNAVERPIRDYGNPLHALTERELIKTYKFGSHSLQYICDLVGPVLQRATHRSNALPVIFQVLAALRYLITGEFQVDVGDHFHMMISQSSVCRSLSGFLDALLPHLHDLIKFPTNPDEIRVQQMQFFQMYGMPHTVSLIDGTHIQIQGPVRNEHIYVNRKSYYSINTQITCDCFDRITNIVARWPGSTHDSTILNHCELARWFEENGNGNLKGAMLGDSGYACKKWLLTPVRNPNTAAERRYNR